MSPEPDQSRAGREAHSRSGITLLDALTPVGTLVVLLALSVYLFGSDSSAGANQIALLLASAVAVAVATRRGFPWAELEQAIVLGISTAMGAILILLSVGALIGTWMTAGTVPAMIYYGLQLLHPSYFLAAACVICAVTAVATGSSWTTAGTLGVGLIGVALGLGVSPAMTAGAVISGAYFGDKMSPLSDTTNLAPAVVGTDLFTHIRHMAWTTGPSFLIALAAFLIIGLTGHVPAADLQIAHTMDTLSSAFHITPFALLPLAIVLFMAYRRVPALPTITIGALLGGVLAVLIQPDAVRGLAATESLPAALTLGKGVWTALANGYVSDTGNDVVDGLLTRGGMSSMLTTVWLILSALTFGALLEHTGMLERLTRALIRGARSTGTLITAVLLSCIGANVIAADQYMAIVLPGKIFRAEFERRGLAPQNLSRAIEDAGTLTSPLVPWNTCGAYMAATLGVATFAYLPFAFFNLLNPFVSGFYAFCGITMVPLESTPKPVAAGEKQPG